MSERICKNCKWWDLLNDECGMCLRATFGSNEFGMEVIDGSGYWAELRTKPDFSCILFEETDD